ncbi:hypothetical protein SDC9_93493 [bioreactor metagenome]|uniref:Uncharacterized protein n=1 Tax=bioreactor metagenome TaxID=1076179 RepID=A0A645A150_9ZZZZ
MTIINVVEDYNQVKLGQERHIESFIDELREKNILKNETEIELSIENCTTDYPATPRLIDFFLSHLSAQQGNKKLCIKVDGLGNKQIYILYILVLEGAYFGINEKIENEDEIDKWVEIIDNKLKENNISLKVIFTPDNKEYNYGI